MLHSLLLCTRGTMKEREREGGRGREGGGGGDTDIVTFHADYYCALSWFTFVFAGSWIGEVR